MTDGVITQARADDWLLGIDIGMEFLGADGALLVVLIEHNNIISIFGAGARRGQKAVDGCDVRDTLLVRFEVTLDVDLLEHLSILPF